MICKKCGADCPDNSKFCYVCGETLETTADVSMDMSAAAADTTIVDTTAVDTTVIDTAAVDATTQYNATPAGYGQQNPASFGQPNANPYDQQGVGQYGQPGGVQFAQPDGTSFGQPNVVQYGQPGPQTYSPVPQGSAYAPYTPQAPEPKKKNTMMIIIIAVVGLLIIAGLVVGALFMLGVFDDDKKDNTTSEEVTQNDDEEERVITPPIEDVEDDKEDTPPVIDDKDKDTTTAKTDHYSTVLLDNEYVKITIDTDSMREAEYLDGYYDIPIVVENKTDQTLSISMWDVVADQSGVESYAIMMPTYETDEYEFIPHSTLDASITFEVTSMPSDGLTNFSGTIEAYETDTKDYEDVGEWDITIPSLKLK